MKDGFIRVSAVTPKIKVADTEYNSDEIIKYIKAEQKKHTKICVFPELSITAYTCNDLFFQKVLIDGAKEALGKIVKATKGHDMLTFVGLPWEHEGKLYNVAAACQDGRLLGLVPKTFLPNYSEFYEARYFTPGSEDIIAYTEYEDTYVPMGTNLIFSCSNMPDLKVACELCEDVWVPNSPSIRHAMKRANVIVNLSASDELVGKNTYRQKLITLQSAKLLCAYIYANAGEGESTQDMVFGGHDIIAEDGKMIAESKRFTTGATTAEIDIQMLSAERRRMTTYDTTSESITEEGKYCQIDFELKQEETKLSMNIDKAPFVPSDESEKNSRCDEILMIQAMGLKKRLEHTGCKKVILGLSGGLDSTLALLVCAKAYDLLGYSHKDIWTITMPGFGTTDRTYTNACELAKRLSTTLKEIDITKAVLQHFSDIGQDKKKTDVTYENAQARERTQILMDLANKEGGLVIGTGDLSELALGWATYNGDHMSMYAVNVSIPKTLIRHLVRYYADTCNVKKLSDILYDVLDTPVSPELLPPTRGKISQKTEDLVGPYELHDFFLYYVLKYAYKPSKVYRLALKAWSGNYDAETIYRWLYTFYKRFFSQQFKRSCLPDGPKVGSIAVSPRGDLRMPSDAVSNIWLKDLESIKKPAKRKR